MKERLKLLEADDEASYEAEGKGEKNIYFIFSSSGNSLMRALTVHDSQNVVVFTSFACLSNRWIYHNKYKKNDPIQIVPAWDV